MESRRPTISSTLTEIARDIATLRSPDLLLTSIVRRARLLLGTDLAYVSLNDAERTETFIRATDGVRTEAYAAIRMPLGTGVLGLAAGGVIAETPDYLPDEGKTHLPAIDRTVQEEGVRAIAGAPLRVAGRVVGALMTANRTPGAFTARQREHLEQIASLAAAAVELVTAKGREAAASEVAAEAVLERDRAIAADALRRELESKLADALAQHRDLDHVVALAASIAGAEVRVTDAAGQDISSSGGPAGIAGSGGPRGSAGAAVEERAPLIGDAAPGAVVVRHAAEPAVPGLVASSVARFASLALLYDRMLDDVRHFHEDELVRALIAPSGQDRAGLSPTTVQRALGADGETCIAVLSPASPDGSGLRRLLSQARALTRDGRTAVAGHLGRVTVVARGSEAELRARLESSVRDVPFFGGIAAARDLRGTPAAHAEAIALAGAMRALARPGVLAGAPQAGVAGLLFGAGESAAAAAFLDAYLGPLLRAPRGEVLLSTALVHLDANGSIARTAEVLDIHPNTVRQRLDRIDEALGSGWRTGPARLDVHVALRLRSLASRTDPAAAVARASSTSPARSGRQVGL
ncbi:helix-turn-helix domain-containing protein [Agromyces kandeliae]|nr:helix-turn-helix domain-containing protein [Agromyces kandeliae]